MDPILLTLAAPHHDLQRVGQFVVRDGLLEQLQVWQKLTGAREICYLSTCQRVLWLIWGGDPDRLGISDAMRLEGEQAWRHLINLACGLASANTGDLDIPAQIRRALEDSLLAGSAGDECHAAIEDVLREALRLRSRLGLDRGAASVASVALQKLNKRLPLGAKVALVGVGAMTRYLAERLPSRGFQPLIVNRSLDNALALAEPLAIPVLSLDAFQADPGDVDAVVSATGAPEPILTKSQWQSVNRKEKLLLIDLALPADSEPELAELPWIERHTLENCLEETEQTLAVRRNLAQQASPLLTDAADRLRIRARHRAMRRERAHIHQEMNKAWDRLESEIGSGVFATLNDEQKAALQKLLGRGRTLAFRTLVQTEQVQSLHQCQEML